MRVACFQSGVQGIDPGVAWRRLLQACGDRGVDLLVTPEFGVGGLPHTSAASEQRAVEDPEWLLPWADGAPPGMTVLLGFTERTGVGLHSSAAVVRDGRVLTVVRKQHPREPGLVPGGDSSVVDVAGTGVGVLVCADATHQEPARRLAAEGAGLLACVLNNDMSEANAARWQRPTHDALAGRARENRCWVVSADVAGTSPGRRALAATRIVRPDGVLLATVPPQPGRLLVRDLV